LFELSNNILFVVIIIGSLTCFLFSIVGAFQQDIKRIIAYSTCSQLGYMVFSCGASQYYVSIFHLFNHAFFKALLFLSAGAIIHALSDEQDIRRMGNLFYSLPFTYICFIIGSLSLIGFPFLTGFYSKDLLLEFIFTRYTITSNFGYFLGVGAIFFTCFYSFRLLYWVFFIKLNIIKSYKNFIHEPNIYMYFPMLLLCISSIFIGYLFHVLALNNGFFF
jgi:NADH-ubiquinone oxidoreductase chain 5